MTLTMEYAYEHNIEQPRKIYEIIGDDQITVARIHNVDQSESWIFCDVWSSATLRDLYKFL